MWDTLFCSTPKSSSRHYFFLPSKWVSFVISVPSKPRIVFSAQKPFYSQPNYSSKWLGNFLVLISSNIINCVPERKQKQGSGWDIPFTYNNLIPIYQMEIQRPGATALTNWSSIYYPYHFWATTLKSSHLLLKFFLLPLFFMEIFGIYANLQTMFKQKWVEQLSKDMIYCISEGNWIMSMNPETWAQLNVMPCKN